MAGGCNLMFAAPIAAANLRRANVLVPNVEVLKEVEPTAARAIAVSISETAPPFCIHSFCSLFPSALLTRRRVCGAMELKKECVVCRGLPSRRKEL